MFAVSVGSGLHQLAKDLGADLLVVGSCRRGSVGRLLRGDDTRDSVSRAACAVAVAPDGYGDRSSRIKTVGVAYNASPEANAALAVARGLAARGGASLKALTVVGVAAAAPGAWGEVDGGWDRTVDASEHEAIGALRDLDAVQHRVALGHTATELIAFGDEVDLLVVGSRGYGPLRRLVLGSTSLRLAREARCPLLIIPRPQSLPKLRTRLDRPPALLDCARGPRLEAAARSCRSRRSDLWPRLGGGQLHRLDGCAQRLRPAPPQGAPDSHAAPHQEPAAARGRPGRRG